VQLGVFAAVLLLLNVRTILAVEHLHSEYGQYAKLGSAHQAAAQLTADIPDTQPVAAYDVVAWPIVATGQRAVSVPWPEPMISDLAARQAAAEQLFDPALTRAQRIGLARSWGARTLILDRRGPNRRRMPEGLIERLDEQSVRRVEAGPFIRFDLE
jgi:hypothetical protein